MKIIFLDIDGVLNDNVFFASNDEKVKEFYRNNGYDMNNIDLMIEREMMDIDDEKVQILKNVITITDAKVVIISSWKKKRLYPFIEKKLVAEGIPIIGVTDDHGSDRGLGIKKYVAEHHISEYIILDDDIFEDYDTDILNRLVKTSFYNGGLSKRHGLELIRKLKVNS